MEFEGLPVGTGVTTGTGSIGLSVGDGVGLPKGDGVGSSVVGLPVGDGEGSPAGVGTDGLGVGGSYIQSWIEWVAQWHDIMRFVIPCR